MSSSSASKINQVLRRWPTGTVALSTWLESQGVYQQLASRYEQSRWFDRIGYGAFTRTGDQVDWTGALYAVQKQGHLPIHVGGKSALELYGLTHFAVAGRKPLFLFGAPRAALPTWFKKKDWGVSVVLTTAGLFPSLSDPGLTEKSSGAFSIQISSRERAALELLHLVPARQQYEEAKLLFEGLQGLRPSLVQGLLEACSSIKVKRLFLHLAEETSQPWFSELKVEKVDLGKGKRMIGKGGHFDPKYNISVPKIREGGSFNPKEGL